MPQHAAMVLSFHMSHSDIAFVVKFKFNEGGSEIGGGGRSPPRGLRQPAHLSGYFLRFWTVYLGSIVKFNAFYEYCGEFQVISVRVRGGDSCGWRY